MHVMRIGGLRKIHRGSIKMGFGCVLGEGIGIKVGQWVCNINFKNTLNKKMFDKNRNKLFNGA